MRNYEFVADYAVVIVTADSKRTADKILRNYVKYPQAFRFEQSDKV